MKEVSVRKRYLPEKRVEITKQHLLEKKTLSDVCDANGIHPTMYYRWLKGVHSRFFVKKLIIYAGWVTRQKTEDRRQKTEVRSQKSEVRSQKSEVRSPRKTLISDL